ncbi:unnamed protein product, partial [Polarella glacialis]
VLPLPFIPLMSPLHDFEGGADIDEPASVPVGDEQGALAPGSEAPLAKRRRKVFFVADEMTEIPNDTYRGYVDDRTGITRKSVLDYTMMLPHYSQQLPLFTTTFTDMCPSLCEGIVNGSEVSEKRRRLAQETEFAGRHQALRQAGGAPSDWALPEPPQPAADGGVPMSSPFSPLLTPIDPSKAGLRSPEVPPPGAPKTPMAPPLLTEQMLLENAPSSLNSVVTGSMDDEDQSGNAAARVGYSGRTEKMHRYLAKEFKDTDEQALSYENLCRLQASGRRELIAGCFFELLVLKTNGVIGIEQDKPLSDIRISKASQWAK